MSKRHKTVTLSDEQRKALEALCRRRKVDALVWKRARAFLLLDAGEDAGTVCRILDIGPTVLTEWQFAFAGVGLSLFGLKDYSQRQGHLSVEQERVLKAHFTEHPARNVDDVCAYVLAECDQNYSTSGAAKLMRRLGFAYKKPQLLPAQADEAKQAAFIAQYEALMNGLAADEMVVFSDAVHPEHQSRPAHGWFPKGQKTALKATSGRKRLNIQGALDLETFQFTFVEGEKINAQTTRQMLEKLERNNQTKTAIHVVVDNARYHHAKILQPWLDSPERRVKLHFLPAYAPHLNPIERLWGVMGFVAQIGLRSDFPFPQTDSSYCHGTRYAKRCEAVQDRGADLDLRNLTIEVARRKALTKQFHTMHLRLDAASAVVPGQVSPQGTAQVL